MAPPPKVLVFGDDTRSFLTCVRSLGRQGIEVHAAPYSLDAPALQSRYIKKIHLLPYYLDGGANWLHALQTLLLAERYDFLLPCEERSILPLFIHQPELPDHTILAIPDAVALDVFFDKVNTRQLAQRCGVVVPEGHVWQESSSVQQLQSDIGFPMVVKHRQSYSLENLYVRTQVRMLNDQEELLQWLHHNQPVAGAVYFEKVVDGIGVGVSVLCHEGHVLQAFEHHRTNELAGSSYYRKSMPPNEERVDAVKRMVNAIHYTGLAMFEFKLDTHSNKWALLEVNARPWGSLPLPVAWGVDFPYRWYQLLCHHQVTSSVPYPAERYNRNLIADIWQMRSLAAQLKNQPAKLTVAILRWLAGFFRILLLHEKHDVLVADDPSPAWTEVKQFVTQRLPKAFLAAPVLRNSSAAISKLVSSKPRHLLFICQGNICRSPYAERIARSIFSSNGLNMTVDSAGMLPRNRRPPPPVAIEAARLTHVDLSSHLSKYAETELILKADIIFIFDEMNLLSFKQRHPTHVNKLFFLSAFNHASDQKNFIEDPEGQDIAEFQKTYAIIHHCLMNLAQKLKAC
jgi:protein-tyrosine-phosphatase/predicted ATP-grasp superfamily ATP-dependent carboligase